MTALTISKLLEGRKGKLVQGHLSNQAETKTGQLCSSPEHEGVACPVNRELSRFGHYHYKLQVNWAIPLLFSKAASNRELLHDAVE